MGWFGKLDSLEAGAASILAHGPTVRVNSQLAHVQDRHTDYGV